jgi:ribosomal protein S18 acetylase RimI-like enzyme
MVATSGASDVVVRIGTTADAPAAARLHTEQLDEGMLSSFGPRFLGYLYRRLTLTHGCSLLIAERDRSPVGFIATTENTGAFYKQFLMRDGFIAAVTTAPRIIRVLPRALETLRHGSKPRAGSTPAEVLSIAVDRGVRSGGIGRALLSAALNDLASKGVPKVQVVVAKDNSAGVGLYKSLGFRVDEEFEMHPGRMSLLMQWSSFPEESGGGTRSADRA